MDNILYFVKFGEREHLQKLVDGKIYFSNPKAFIDIEKEQLNRGQGDRQEGRTMINFSSISFYDKKTYQLVNQHNDILGDIGYQYVDKMPIFCLTAVFKEDCKKLNSSGEYIIKFNKDKEHEVRKSFPKADSALIIKTPELFINDVCNIFASMCKYDLVKYYPNNSKGQLTIEMMDYIVNDTKNSNLIDGDFLMKFTCEEANIKGYVTIDNVYKVLFCKDSYFKEQQEFRFVANRFNINNSGLFDIEMHSDSELFTLDEFFNGIKIINKEQSQNEIKI